MRKFDVKAINNKATQYWSSLSTTANAVVGQVPNSAVSNIVFGHKPNFYENFAVNLDNWNVLYPDRITMDDTQSSQTGSYAIKLASIGGGYSAAETDVEVVPGGRYRFYVSAKKTADFDGVTNSKLRISNAVGGALIGAVQYNAVYLSDTDWTTRWAELNIPQGMSKVRVQIYNDSTAGNVWLDEIYIVRVDAGGLDPASNNRNITSDSETAIVLSNTEGTVTAPEFTNFSLSMVIQPNQADLWLFKLGDNLGARINSDSSLSLHWTVDGQTVSERIMFDEQVSYFALSRTGTEITMQLNGESVTINGDDYSFTEWKMGAGTGTVLVDRIAFSVGGNLPRAIEYFGLFRQQRLDTVPRPNGEAGFTYIDDITAPVLIKLDKNDFQSDGEYSYSAAQNATIPGVWHIDKRASFEIEYSVDRGISWEILPQSINLNDPYREILFRHLADGQVDYHIDIRITSEFDIPTAFFDTQITGPVHLPVDSGVGYYDAECADFSNATVRVTRMSETDEAGTTTITGNPIRSVEFLGTVADIHNFMKDQYSELIRVKNGDFENGTADWNFINNATISTEQARSGTRSVKMVNGAEISKGPAEQFDTAPGDQWGFSAWFKNIDFTGSGGLRFQRRIASTGQWTTFIDSTMGTPGTDWTLFSKTGTVPADTDKVRARIAIAATGTVFVDDVSVWRVTDKSPNRVDNRLFDIYINGRKRELDTLKPDQIYHIIFVFDLPVDYVDMNPSGMVGLGASSVAYTEADAFYIFNVFAGSTFISGMEEITTLRDGVSPNSDPAAPYAALELQWNN